jgi:phosphoserine phosphatase
LISTIVLALFFFGCGTKGGVEPPEGKQLIQGNWDQFNRVQLNKMLAQYGNEGPNYDAAKKPYVVFDWDNTSVFLDIQEAVLIYQLQNLLFNMTPAQMNAAIRMGLDKKDFVKDYNNAAGQPVNIDKIAPDIVAGYTWLYQNYKGLKGKKSLEEVKSSPQYQDFTTKVRYLYEAISDTFDHAVAYPWVLYLLTGLTEAQVRDMTAKTVDWQLAQPIESVKWTSPSGLPGKAGVVSVSWKNGLRLVPEMQDLYKKLRDNGFDVWVCSASFVDVIKEISSNPKFGYNNSDKNVIAMELERDRNGRIMTAFRKGYDQTQGPGKTKALQRFVVAKYGYGPIFIAGDSEGDQNMMNDFDTIKTVLIVNRLRNPKNPIGQFSKTAVDTYGKPDAKYLLQGRDDNKGVFVPSQLHFKLGSTEGQALRK